jgi:hypothetical protein
MILKCPADESAAAWLRFSSISVVAPTASYPMGALTPRELWSYRALLETDTALVYTPYHPVHGVSRLGTDTYLFYCALWPTGRSELLGALLTHFYIGPDTIRVNVRNFTHDANGSRYPTNLAFRVESNSPLLAVDASDPDPVVLVVLPRSFRRGHPLRSKALLWTPK